MRNTEVQKTLPEPVKIVMVPSNAQWLAGEESGSWFVINYNGENYNISRYNVKGMIECSGIFFVSNKAKFEIEKPYQITYLSHCEQVLVIQNNLIVRFERM